MNQTKSFWIKRIIGITLAASSLLAYADSVVGRFEVVRYDVQGNTILSDQEINRLLAPYVGKDQDFSAIQKAVDVLEAAYRQRGYKVVKVVLPEQELDHGVVKLKVLETKIGKVTVTGNKFFDSANIERSLPSLKEGITPNMDKVAANLKLANENPQKKYVVQLQSENQEGTVDATIQVTDEKPWSAAITVDNTGDPNSGLNRITGLYQYANVGGLDHVLGLQYTTSIEHPRDAKIFGAGYHIPFYALNDSLDLFASYANVDAGNINISGIGGGGFEVSGNGLVVGSRYNHNFLKKGNYESVITGGLDYKSFRNDISFNDVPLGNNVTVHPISLAYSGNWSIVGTTFYFNLAGYHNIPGGTHGGGDDFEAARAHANSNYNLLRYTAIFAHAFKGDWQVRFVLNGQSTSDALIQGEQFGAGGATSVRGFYEREIINDEGRTTNLELYTPNLCQKQKWQCRLLAFYDTGYLSRNDPLPEEIDSQSIGSVGLGFRFNLAPHWTAQTDWAHVVDGTTISPKGSNRAHFKLILTF
jgi:hemolysin activation/secretion protein